MQEWVTDWQIDVAHAHAHTHSPPFSPHRVSFVCFSTPPSSQSPQLALALTLIPAWPSGRAAAERSQLPLYVCARVKCHTCLRPYAGLVYECVWMCTCQSPRGTQRHPWPRLMGRPLKIVGHLGCTYYSPTHTYTQRYYIPSALIIALAPVSTPPPPFCSIHRH